jgi:general secretion pathway protein B
MSYILDALKKSDQERQQGTTPGLHTSQSAPLPEKKKRPVWPYLLSAALLLNGGILAGLLWSRSPMTPVAPVENRTAAADAPAPATVKMSSPKEAAPTPPVAVTSEPKASAPAVGAGEKSDKKEQVTFKTASPKAPEMQGTSSQPEVKENNREEKKKATAPGGFDRKLKVEAVVPAAPPRPPAAPRASSPHSNIAQQNHARNSALDESRRIPPAPVESQPPPPSPAPASVALPAAPQAAPEPQQLPVKEKPPVPGNPPASVQREMPGISLSFLVYSDNAAERMVSINGKMMREGQEISPDMKLDEITPNGVILSYRGHRFHKNLF